MKMYKNNNNESFQFKALSIMENMYVISVIFKTILMQFEEPTM